MKLSERLRLEASLGNNVYSPWPMVVLREAADLLDECERAFEFIARGDCGCDECNKARDTLAKLRAQEKEDE